MAAKKKPEATGETPSLVTVVALANLYEGDCHHKKGETFQLDAARAAVLPELVSLVETPAE